MDQIIEFLELTRDEEIQANCAKILRISLRDEVVSLLFVFEALTMSFIVRISTE